LASASSTRVSFIRKLRYDCPDDTLFTHIRFLHLACLELHMDDHRPDTPRLSSLSNVLESCPVLSKLSLHRVDVVSFAIPSTLIHPALRELEVDIPRIVPEDCEDTESDEDEICSDVNVVGGPSAAEMASFLSAFTNLRSLSLQGWWTSAFFGTLEDKTLHCASFIRKLEWLRLEIRLRQLEVINVVSNLRSFLSALRWCENFSVKFTSPQLQDLHDANQAAYDHVIDFNAWLMDLRPDSYADELDGLD
jgi:hypothetical protein